MVVNRLNSCYPELGLSWQTGLDRHNPCGTLIEPQAEELEADGVLCGSREVVHYNGKQYWN